MKAGPMNQTQTTKVYKLRQVLTTGDTTLRNSCVFSITQKFFPRKLTLDTYSFSRRTVAQLQACTGVYLFTPQVVSFPTCIRELVPEERAVFLGNTCTY